MQFKFGLLYLIVIRKNNHGSSTTYCVHCVSEFDIQCGAIAGAIVGIIIFIVVIVVIIVICKKHTTRTTSIHTTSHTGGTTVITQQQQQQAQPPMMYGQYSQPGGPMYNQPPAYPPPQPNYPPPQGNYPPRF
ncbi:uncharacterized protein LOC143072031 isoform X3 [Mytilus galloprovincialis]|uniref:uncharacterized protein LOC143072031 isoform X3 n=1 Tax=Mytilus galloprovincialis TaxID=29158 RepID=UPI003F7BBB02